jgi:antitoxin component YwqK of YwqJK toxin-antitoxin module
MKLKKQFICLIYLLIQFLVCYSQPNRVINYPPSAVNCSNCNFKDSLGRKQGLWVDDDEVAVTVYYKDNKRDGVYIAYSQVSCSVIRFGEYSKGIPCGKWYYFDERNHLEFTEENIQRNTKYTWKRENGIEVPYEFTSYLRDYYTNGIIKDEGQVLYNEDAQIESDKIGTWKYYDEKGKLIETVNGGIRRDLDK